MIVLGADMHKSSHTIAAVAATTGEMLGEKTATVGVRGFDQVLRWARALGRERVWALEDCRTRCSMPLGVGGQLGLPVPFDLLERAELESDCAESD